MATRRYSINPQEPMHRITEAVGAAVATKNIEVTIDFDALAALTPKITGTQARFQVAEAVRRIAEHIETHNWPPA
jgi:hypothetical protein